MEYIFLAFLDVLVLYYNYFVGITVAYSAPTRHGCLKVVDNNYCASRRGMIPLLSDISTSVFLCTFNYSITFHLMPESLMGSINLKFYICITYRWRSLSIHLESYLRHHLWSSCLVSWFKSLDFHEQLLHTFVLVL